MKDIDVSIVIVCMNNLNNLDICLNSLRKNTTRVSYETLVVAYLFTKENLMKARNDYPWVNFIESDEIRGFSENNNLALKQARGRYCFVVNDDTEMKMPVIDLLVDTIESLPKEVAIVSPHIYLDRINCGFSGKPRYNLTTYILDNLRISKLYTEKSSYVDQKGVFKTYNISGAAFLIKTDVFSKMGFFDEKYFFCPEDIALSTKINREGYKCYVNSDVTIHHYSGGTWSKMITATKPASTKGAFYFYSDNSILKELVFVLFSLSMFLLRIMYWMTLGRSIGRSETMRKANFNSIIALFSKKTPKELFIQFYSKLK